MKKNTIQFNLKSMFRILMLAILTGFVSGLNAQCDTQISDPDGDGKDYVCAGSITSYTATRDSATLNSVFSWALSGGGTIVSVVNNSTTSTVSIQWNNTPATGPFCLTLTEHDAVNVCTGSDKLYVYIETENLVMACNPLVLVSLDNNCQATITGDMILEAPLYPNSSYSVTVLLSSQATS